MAVWARFHACKLARTRWARATLDEVAFSECSLTANDWREARVTALECVASSFAGSWWSGAAVARAAFDGADLQGSAGEECSIQAGAGETAALTRGPVRAASRLGKIVIGAVGQAEIATGVLIWKWKVRDV